MAEFEALPPLHSRAYDIAQTQLAQLSTMVDESPANAARDPEALSWHRVTKVCEEAGEALGEWLLFTGGNPRKPASSGDTKVVEELLDCAVAALGGIEHLRGNRGVALSLLVDKIDRVHRRALESFA